MFFLAGLHGSLLEDGGACLERIVFIGLSFGDSLTSIIFVGTMENMWILQHGHSKAQFQPMTEAKLQKANKIMITFLHTRDGKPPSERK
jgi:hypothetical protein